MDEMVESQLSRPHPDIEALNESGHRKFKSIDVKLGVAMTAMLRAGNDRAAELYLEVNRKSNEYVRDYDGKIIKGSPDCRHDV